MDKTMERTLWMQYIREVHSTKEWSHYQQVAIDDKIYIFGYDQRNTDGIFEVLIFDTKDYSLRYLYESEHGDKTVKTPCRKIFFAVAHGKKVYICGNKSPCFSYDLDVNCFNTETLEWTTLETRGNIPSGNLCGTACIINDKLFVCIDYYDGVTIGIPSVYALDLFTGLWECQCKHKWAIRMTPRAAAVLGTKMFVVFIKWTNLGDNNNCIGYYETTERRWQWLDPPYSGSYFGPNWTIFAYGDDIYILPSEVNLKNPPLHNQYANKIEKLKHILKYSAQQDVWTQVKYIGEARIIFFNSVVVVGDKAFFYCGISKEIYLIDMFPSLQSLSMQSICLHNLNSNTLPKRLKKELECFYNYKYDKTVKSKTPKSK